MQDKQQRENGCCCLVLSLLSLQSRAPNQGTAVPTFRLDLPTSIKAIKIIFPWTCHRPGWSRKSLIDTLFSDNSELCQLELTTTAVVRHWEGMATRSTEGFQGSVYTSCYMWQWVVDTSKSCRIFNTPRVSLNAKYGLWVIITCHCDFINHNKCTTLTLACDVQSREDHVYIEAKVTIR